MTVNEVAGLLGYSREQVLGLIANGLKLPKSGEMLRLATTQAASQIEVSDEQLDEFLGRFEAEEPGRYPPVAVRRELLIEARHACTICRAVAPPQFHHMLDWAKVKHHDAGQMLVVCGTCHSRCSNGQIDYQSQVQYKAALKQVAVVDQVADPQRERKRAEDLHTLADLFRDLPRHYVDGILAELSQGQHRPDYAPMLDVVSRKVTATIFHCYDRDLVPLFRDFVAEWSRVQAQADRFYRKEREWDDVAGLIVNGSSPPDLRELHVQFLQRVERVKHLFVMLNTYVRDQYPEFDLDESDRDAAKRWDAKRRKARSRLW